MDLESTDGSAEIAASHGASVIRREPLPIVEPLRNEIAGRARHDWILALDPDEGVTPGLAAELRRLATRDDIDAVVIPRMNIDLGYAPSSPVQRYEGQLRMYRRDRVQWPLFPNECSRPRGARPPLRCESASGGPAERLYLLPKEDGMVLLHERNRSLPEALERAMRYAPAEARAMLDAGQTFSGAAIARVLLKAADRQVFEARAWNDGVPGLFRAAILVNHKLSVWIASGSQRSAAPAVRRSPRARRRQSGRAPLAHGSAGDPGRGQRQATRARRRASPSPKRPTLTVSGHRRPMRWMFVSSVNTSPLVV